MKYQTRDPEPFESDSRSGLPRRERIVSSSEYEIIDGLRFRRKVRALVQNRRGDMLLIQPHGYDDSWTLVGGGIEHGETPEEAIRRELREELGIPSILELRLLGGRDTFRFSKKHREKHGHDGQAALMFWVVIDDDVQIALQLEEVKAHVWIRCAEIESYVKVPKQLNLLRTLLEEIGAST